MRRLALLTLVCLGCTFDATGVGMAPGVTSGGITTLPTSSGPTDTGVEPSGGETGTDTTVGVSGSGSMTGETTSSTTEPATATDPGTTTTTTTTDASTTAMGSSGGCTEVPGYVDMDQDGNGDPTMPTMGCVGDPGFATNNIDCNDAEPKAWSGHPENCDGVDNDCDGKIDEYDAAGNADACGGCDYKTRDGRLYLFCSPKKSWLDAQIYCKYFNSDLMIETDGGEHTWLATELLDNFDLWWIGGEDFTSQSYKWVDGMSMPGGGWPWAGGEPNNDDSGLDADCVVYRRSVVDRVWADYVCSKSFKFICEGPQP